MIRMASFVEAHEASDSVDIAFLGAAGEDADQNHRQR